MWTASSLTRRTARVITRGACVRTLHATARTRDKIVCSDPVHEVQPLRAATARIEPT